MAKGMCARHEDRKAVDLVLIEGGLVRVCSECLEKVRIRTRFYCKYCGVAIKSKEDTTPIGDATHKIACPRSKWGEEDG